MISLEPAWFAKLKPHVSRLDHLRAVFQQAEESRMIVAGPNSRYMVACSDREGRALLAISLIHCMAATHTIEAALTIAH